MSSTSIKLHFYKTDLLDSITIGNTSFDYSAFKQLKKKIIHSNESKDQSNNLSNDLNVFNIFLLKYLGHVGVSFPQSDDENIYGFGPILTKEIIAALATPVSIFDDKLHLNSTIYKNNDFFDFVKNNDNKDIKSKYYEINLIIDDSKEIALKKLYSAPKMHYGYPPIKNKKENCVSFIFNILKPKYTGSTKPIVLKQIGNLTKNLWQLLEVDRYLDFWGRLPPKLVESKKYSVGSRKYGGKRSRHRKKSRKRTFKKRKTHKRK